MYNQMFVIKRNGTKEKVMFDKITLRISKLINPDEEDILDPMMIAQKVISSIYSGITTEELDLESAKICSNMVTINPSYGMLAGRILASNLQKKTDNSFVDKMNMIQKINNILDTKWLEWINENKEQLDSIVNYDRDYLFDYFGFKTLERSYLTKNQITGEYLERPQDVFMREASYICMGDIDKIKITYDLLSTKAYTHASPTMFNAGTSRPQLSSCFLLNTNDSLEGITKTWDRVARISKWAGGIGLHVSNIRSKGSIIRGTNAPSSGIIPMLQVYNNIARYINQGGKRKGAFAIYLEPHHPDIMDFLELKKNTGAETERARDLFLALWVSDLFMEKVENDEMWYLLDPDECPGLNTTYGEEYKTLYNSYVEQKKYKNTIMARKLMDKIMDAQLETGVPYMLFKDHVNNKSNQKNIDVVCSSNLCAEITLVSNDEEHAVCNLASISVNKFAKPFKSEKQWTIYTKDDCKYCKWAKNYMKYYKFDFIEKTDDSEKKLEEYRSEPECGDGVCRRGTITYPQIFYGDTHIGGFNDLIQYTAYEYDFNDLWETAYIATMNLDHVIDKNYYPTPETKCSNMRNRPLGLGIQGLADALVLMKIPFESEMALRFNKNMMETIYHAAMTASMHLAKARHDDMKQFITKCKEYDINIPEYYEESFVIPMEKDGSDISDMNELYHIHRIHKCELKLTSHYGAYSSFIGSPLYEGKFQFDLWNESGSLYCWDDLREDIMMYGVRNSNVTALMPTAATAQIMGNNECFEWFTSNIYTRRTLAGDFILVNKHLVNDLLAIGEWNKDVEQILIASDSNMNILDIPPTYKELYKTMWDIKQLWVLKHARARAPFVDMTQSMNIFFATPDYAKLMNTHMWAWKNGLKTGMYYLRTKPAENAVKVTVDPKLEKRIAEMKTEECESCSA